MPDYLDALIARSIDAPAAIEPRVPALFEPVKPDRRLGPMRREATDESPAAIHRVRDSLSSDRPVGSRRFGDRRPDHDALTPATESDGTREARSTSIPTAGTPDLPARLLSLEQRLDVKAAAAAQSPSRGDSARVESVLAPPAVASTVPGPMSDPVSRVRAAAQRRSLDISRAPDTPAATPMAPTVDAHVTRASATVDALTVRLESLARRLDLAPTPMSARQSREVDGDRRRAPSGELAPARASGRDVDQRQPTTLAPAPRPPRAELRNLTSSLPGARHQTFVEVTIGRIELQAAAEPVRPQPARADAVTATSLDDYLRRRNGGSR